ncbi:MAG: signal peptidase I [Planctomycetota bacterium]
MARKQRNAPPSEPGPPAPPPIYRLALDWGVSIGLAVAMAVLIKWTVFDVYSIPSGSMEPVLHGDEQSGDRVFCFKQAYRFRKENRPERYEVVVFRFPVDDPNHDHYGQNYIKRCVGFPGETVYVRDGDLYVAGRDQPVPKRAPKPLALQDSLWIPVHRQAFDHSDHDALWDAIRYHWEVIDTPEGAWTLGDGALRGETRTAIHLRYRARMDLETWPGVTDRHVKRQVVEFVCLSPSCGGRLRKTVASQQLTAYCPRCGDFMSEVNIDSDTFAQTGLVHRDQRPQRGDDYHLVRDLRLACRATPRSDAGELHLQLATSRDAFRARLGFGPTGRAVLERDGRPVAEAALPWPAGTARALALFRADGRVVLRVDGEEILRTELDGSLPEAGIATRRTEVQLSLVEGAATVDDLTLDRDLFYFYAPYEELPPEAELDGKRLDNRLAYFNNFLGDRSPATLGRLRHQAMRMARERCFIVPETGYLAFGDNQPTSNDSRQWGPAPEANLIGPAYFIWWPPHRAAILH